MPLERKTKAKSFKTSGLLCVFTLGLQQTWNWIICKKGMVEWCRMLSVVLMDLSKDFEHALSAVQRNPTQPNQHDIKLSSHVILLGPGQMLHPSLVIQQYLRVDQHPQHRHLMSFGFTVLPETGVCFNEVKTNLKNKKWVESSLGRGSVQSCQDGTPLIIEKVHLFESPDWNQENQRKNHPPPWRFLVQNMFFF